MMVIVFKIIIILGFLGVLFVILRKIPCLARLSQRYEEFYGGEVVSSKEMFVRRIKDYGVRLTSSSVYQNVVIPVKPYLKKASRLAWLTLGDLLRGFITYSLKFGIIFLGVIWSVLDRWFRAIRTGSLEISSKSKKWLIRVKIERQRKEEEKRDKREERRNIRAILKNPKDIEAYKNLGALYFKLNNYKDARAALIRVLKIRGEDEEAEELLEAVRRRIKEQKK